MEELDSFSYFRIMQYCADVEISYSFLKITFTFFSWIQGDMLENIYCIWT